VVGAEVTHTARAKAKKVGKILFLTLFVLFLVGEGLVLVFVPDLRSIVQSDPQLSYRLKPNTCCRIYSYLRFEKRIIHYCTGELGQRVSAEGAAPLDQRPTIACFGDSNTWGDGLEDEEAYPAQLGALLPDNQVLNFGVSGYNAYQELWSARRYLASATPALVIQQLCQNDDDPAFQMPAADRLLPPTLLGRLCWTMYNIRKQKKPPLDAAHAIAELAATCRQKHAPLVLYVMSRPPSLRDVDWGVWRRQGVCVLDGAQIRFVSSRDYHPDQHLSADGNARLAYALVHTMKTCGLLTDAATGAAAPSAGR
jgi:hypothetical protein